MVEAGELTFFFDTPSVPAEMLAWKGGSLSESKEHLMAVAEKLSASGDDSFNDVETIKALVFDYATEKGRGNVLWPLRVALSGKEKSPDPFTLVYILGKTESINRIHAAVKQIQ
jgi:glutamyl/glutaminyl-tRNA synthetase